MEKKSPRNLFGAPQYNVRDKGDIYMSIYESSTYKVDLRKEVRSIKYMLRHGNYESDENEFRLEKFVFVSAFLIRKLFESKKLSDELESETFWGFSAPAAEDHEINDYFDRYKIDKNYLLDQRDEVEFKIIDLVNLLIHSYIFFIGINDELIGENDLLDNVNHFELIFTSDRKKGTLYFLRLPVYLELCRKVYTDQIAYARYGLLNAKSEHRVVLTKSRVSSEGRHEKQVIPRAPE